MYYVNILKLNSNFFTRLAHSTLGKVKPNKYWQYSTVLVFLVANNIIKNLLMTKSREVKSDLVKRQALSL